MKYLIKKLVEKQFIQTTAIFMALFLLSAVSINTVIAQVRTDLVPPEYVAKHLTATASNTHPKINEPVTIKMKYKAESDHNYSIHIGSYEGGEGIQLISGDLSWRGKLKKDQIIEKEITIKFTKKRVYRYSVRVQRSPAVSKGIGTGFVFYVGGAFDEDYRISDVRKRILRLKNALADTSLKGEAKREAAGLSSLSILYSSSLPRRTQFNGNKKSPVQQLTVEQIAKNKKNKGKNDNLLIKLQKEYDSLKTLLPPPKRGFPLNIIIKKDSVIKDNSIIDGSNIEKPIDNKFSLSISGDNTVKAIVNHNSNEFWAQNSYGEIVDMDNWRVEPSSLGYITEDNTTHKVIFHAYGSAGAGTIYATDHYYGIEHNLGAVKVIANYKIKGYFNFKDKNGNIKSIKSCAVGVYDYDTQSFADVISTGENGYYEFADLNVSNIGIIVYSYSYYGEVYDARDNNINYRAGYIIPYIANLIDDNNVANLGTGTIEFNASPETAAAFNILNEIKKGYKYVHPLAGNYPPRVDVNWNPTIPEWDPVVTPDGGTWYNGSFIQLIGITDDADQWDESVILHEYGHFIMDKFAESVPNAGGDHTWTSGINDRLAYSEGWATFFSCAVLNNPVYFDALPDNVGDDISINVELPTDNPLTNLVEGAVCAALWDIFDSNSDVTTGTYTNNDNLSLGINDIWDIVTNYTINNHFPYTFYDFSTGWYEKSYPSIKDLSLAHGVDVAPFSLHMNVLPVLMEQSYYSGAAAAQMTLSYLGVFQSQDNIQNAGGSGTADMDGSQAESAVTTFQPAPYTFGRGTFQDANSATAFLAKWVSYDISVDKPTGSGPHYAPGMIPLDGSYNNWAVVNGVVTSANPYPDGAVYTLYGFWVTEPNRSSGNIQQLALAKSSALIPSYLGGGESYLTAAAFQTKYKSIAGQWTAICEPPEGALGNPIISAPIPVTAESDSQIVQIVLAALNTQPGLGDVIRERHLLEGKIHGNIALINKLGVDDPYYIIPFNKAGKTYIGVIIDGYGFYLEEAALPSEAVNYHLMKKQKAINLLVSQGYISHSQNPEGKLVYSPLLSINQYYPAWEITAEGQTFYVTQNGEIKLPNDLPKIQHPKDITLPHIFSLGQNYPNPFNPTTQITYQIPKDGFVSLVVYNTLGQKIVSLVSQNQVSGKYTVNFNADNLPSGIYIYKMKSGNFSEVKKMILLK